jgi:PAS domain S-box-containing protein
MEKREGSIQSEGVPGRDRTEEALRKSEERYRFLFERSPAVNLIIDADGRLRDVTKSFADRLGYSKDEIVGKQALEFVPGEQREKVAAVLEMALRGEDTPEMDVDVYAKDGSVHTIFFSPGQVVLKEEGQPTSVLYTGADITERKRAEEALRRRAEELAALQATVLEITGRPDLPILLQTIVERAARLLGAPAGGMYLCDPNKQEARCVVSYNTPHDYTGTVLKYGEGAAGTVAQTGMPLVIDNYRTWQGRATVFEEERPFSALLTVPMIWQGRVTGVIHVLDDAASRCFTQADQELLTLFANHAAIVVENTRLLEQEKHHAEELTRYSSNLEQLVLERTGKLAESERRFRELAELLPQIVFEMDEKGNLTFLNRVAFASTGYSEDDLRRGLNAFQMFVPEDHDRAMQSIRGLLSGEKLSGDQYTVLRKDGTTFPAVVYAARAMHENRAVGLRGIVIDITERKRLEEELRSTRERLEYIVTSNPAAIYSGKPLADYSDWHLTYISESVVTILGFEPREFIGHPEFWERHVPPEDALSVLAEMPRLWKDGQHAVEYRFLHKDGTYRWIREESKLVRDADGKPMEVIGYWTDITERRRMENALRESERRFRDLADLLPQIVFEIDEKGTVQFMNRAAFAATGCTEEDFRKGLNAFHMFALEDHDRAIRGIRRTMTGETIGGREFTVLRRDGTAFPVIVYTAPIMREGKTVGVRGIAIDITERKRMEARLVESQRLAAIGETAAMVGHDLRNPLQGIASTLYLAKKTLKSPKTEKRKGTAKLLNTLDDEVYYMDKIVSDLQDYAGPLTADLVETSLSNIIRNTISTIGIPRTVKVSVTVQKGLSKIVIDPTLMRRVLTNLMTNALQAMPQGGRLTIRASKKRKATAITVQDTGEGIPRENMKKIFSPFFTTKAKGQGLGLPVCKRLVEAQGGTITVKSKVGKGSTFTVEIPARAKPGAR